MSENNHLKEILLAKQEFMKFVRSVYPLDKTYKCDECQKIAFSVDVDEFSLDTFTLYMRYLWCTSMLLRS